MSAQDLATAMKDPNNGPPMVVVNRPDIELQRQMNASRSIEIIPVRLPILTHHKLVLWKDEERLVPPGHVAEGLVLNGLQSSDGKDIDLVKLLQGDPTNVFGVPILEVEDADGQILKRVRVEARVFDTDCPARVPAKGIAIIPQLALIRYVKASASLAKKQFTQALLEATPERGQLERRVYLQAREGNDTEVAMAAFEVLFKHYSLNEELDRLHIWMDGNLPFTLEEHPGMEAYRQCLDRQTGHLKDSAAHWYATGSPSSGLNPKWIAVAKSGADMPLRLQWLVTECRKYGCKRVAEYGAIDGSSLFWLVHCAPDIEWHGFEINPDIVEEGNRLAKENDVPNFNLHLMTEANRCGEFDAVALFEALEHNTEREGAQLLRAAEMLLVSGGHMFITTPHGNWSGFNPITNEIELRKDHIRAYTVKRMEEFLRKYSRAVAGTLDVKKVENPNIHESNSWVFASYRT